MQNAEAKGLYDNYNESAGFNTFYRWKAYEYAYPYTNWTQEIYNSIDPSSDDTILDLGCGSGWFLGALRQDYGHQGRLIGVDPNVQQFESEATWRQAYGDDYLMEDPKKELLKGNIQNIPLPDNTADRILLAYSMYYIAKAEQPQAFSEIKRISKPGARTVFTTSARNNKPKHRAFEEEIRKYLNIKQKPRMNEDFDSEWAATILPNFYGRVKRKPLYRKMIFPTFEHAQVYILSLDSMKSEYDPPPRASEFFEAVETVVVPKIKAEISETGRFEDEICRDFFECE